MNKRRFEYALEPVLLTKQWDLDALLIELGALNEQVAQHQAALERLREQQAKADGQWRALSASSAAMSVEQFELVRRYAHDLALQATKAQETLATSERERDATIERVVLSQRSVEVFEEHREHMKERFTQLRLSGEFKLADDQWNTLQARIMDER